MQRRCKSVEVTLGGAKGIDGRLNVFSKLLEISLQLRHFRLDVFNVFCRDTGLERKVQQRVVGFPGVHSIPVNLRGVFCVKGYPRKGQASGEFRAKELDACSRRIQHEIRHERHSHYFAVSPVIPSPEFVRPCHQTTLTGDLCHTVQTRGGIKQPLSKTFPLFGLVGAPVRLVSTGNVSLNWGVFLGTDHLVFCKDRVARNHTLQFVNVDPTDHRNQLCFVKVAQCHLQRCVRVQNREAMCAR